MISVKDRAPAYPGRVQLNPVTGQPNIFDLMRADSPTEVGTGLNRRTMQLLQADIRTHPIAPGNTVEAGDVVDVVGGEVRRTWTGNANTKTVFNSAATTYQSTTKLSEIHSVVCYATGTTGVAKLINNQTGESVGSPITFSAVATSYISCTRLSDTQFIVAYIISTGFYTKLGTVTGTSISFSSESQPSPYANLYNSLIPLDSTSAFCVYARGTRLGAKVLTISGGTVNTSGAEALIESVTPAYISADRLPDAPNGDKRVCVCYSDAGDGNKGKAVIATINASNVVSWGTPRTFESATTTETDCCDDGDDAVVFYVSANICYARILSVDGTGIVENLPLNISSTAVGYSQYPQINNAGNGFAVTYKHPGGKAAVLTRDGTALSKGEEYAFEANTLNYISSASSGDGGIITTYSDAGNSNYGTATLLTVKGNQIAGSFTNTSSQAIALQSGSTGQSIDIIFDGVAELPGITAGAQITSAGVQGYAPQAGWIWVRPAWEQNYGPYYISGAYTGDGVAGRVITIGVRAALVIIQGGVTTSDYDGLAVIADTGHPNGFAMDGYPRATPMYGAVISNTGFTLPTGASKTANVSGVAYKYTALILRKG